MKYQTGTVSTGNKGRLPKRGWTLGLSTVLLASTLLSGCSGGSESDSATAVNIADDTGELALALTDAEGDFLTYSVDVSSIELTRRDGAVVETLPINTTVDFAQYVDVSELLTLATIPAGVYTTIELNLDFTAANVIVQSDNGNPIQATLLDSDGNSLEQLSVSLALTGGSNFTITPGTPTHVTLDLDLDASNQVTVDGDTATVVVEPILLADTQFENPKSLRLRGLLNSVAPADNIFSLNIRPFRHRTGNFGTVRVHVDERTNYEIDGIAYDAQSGIKQLATLSELTPIVSLGEWDKDLAQYTVTTLLAGSSVPWGESDALRGVVSSRNDNTLTVKGAVIELANGNYQFLDNIVVTVSDQTTMTQQLQTIGNTDITHISVGSTISAMGELTADNSLDASTGHVRIHLGNITGNIVSVSPLNIDLQRLSGRNVNVFDFSGTGTDSSSDSTPNNYEVDTGSLSLGQLNLGDPVKVRGTVNSFGTAPEDFVAQTVLDASELNGHMVIAYSTDGSQNAITQATDQSLVFDINSAMTRHHVNRAGILTDLSNFETMPVVIPAEQTGIFAITRRGHIELYRHFSEFVTALNNALAAGEKVTRFDAYGHFNDGNVQLSSKRLRVGLTQ